VGLRFAVALAIVCFIAAWWWFFRGAAVPSPWLTRLALGWSVILSLALGWVGLTGYRDPDANWATRLFSLFWLRWLRWLRQPDEEGRFVHEMMLQTLLFSAVFLVFLTIVAAQELLGW